MKQHGTPDDAESTKLSITLVRSRRDVKVKGNAWESKILLLCFFLSSGRRCGVSEGGRDVPL